MKVTGGAPPPGEEETRTMTPSQCKTLEAIVGGLVHKEALSKIDPKLTGDVKLKAENGAVDAARTVSESFHDSCQNNLVGKPIRREVLDCMLKAKDFATFSACNKLRTTLRRFTGRAEDRKNSEIPSSPSELPIFLFNFRDTARLTLVSL